MATERENKVVKYVFEMGREKYNLNDLWKMYEMGLFTIEEMREFYYLIGSSESLMDEIDEFNK